MSEFAIGAATLLCVIGAALAVPARCEVATATGTVAHPARAGTIRHGTGVPCQ